jgi:hypothetical protein
LKAQLRIQGLLMEEEDIRETSEAYYWATMWRMKFNLRKPGPWVIEIERFGKTISNEELDRTDFDTAFGEGVNKILHGVNRPKIGKYRQKKTAIKVQRDED